MHAKVKDRYLTYVGNVIVQKYFKLPSFEENLRIYDSIDEDYVEIYIASSYQKIKCLLLSNTMNPDVLRQITRLWHATY